MRSTVIGLGSFLTQTRFHCLLIIREGIGKPMTVNNWHRGGKYQQRGLRTIVQQLVKDMFRRGILYLSAHLFGKAFDFTVQGMTANEVRNWIVQNAHLFPCKIRLERKLRGQIYYLGSFRYLSRITQSKSLFI